MSYWKGVASDMRCNHCGELVDQAEMLQAAITRADGKRIDEVKKQLLGRMLLLGVSRANLDKASNLYAEIIVKETDAAKAREIADDFPVMRRMLKAHPELLETR